MKDVTEKLITLKSDHYKQKTEDQSAETFIKEASIQESEPKEEPKLQQSASSEDLRRIAKNMIQAFDQSITKMEKEMEIFK